MKWRATESWRRQPGILAGHLPTEDDDDEYCAKILCAFLVNCGACRSRM